MFRLPTRPTADSPLRYLAQLSSFGSFGRHPAAPTAEDPVPQAREPSVCLKQPGKEVAYALIRSR